MEPGGGLPDIETVVVATDGSQSVARAVGVALDLADRFDAAVHALSVIDTGEVEAAPQAVQDDLRTALEERAAEALATVERRTDRPVTTAVRAGPAADTITDYADEIGADIVAAGTRGRHGEHRFLLGSVAERLVRTCPVPVLTVRQLEGTAPSEPAVAAEADGAVGGH